MCNLVIQAKTWAHSEILMLYISEDVDSCLESAIHELRLKRMHIISDVSKHKTFPNIALTCEYFGINKDNLY